AGRAGETGDRLRRLRAPGAVQRASRRMPIAVRDDCAHRQPFGTSAATRRLCTAHRPTRSAGSRDDARAAYADAVRERYRSYGVYISQQLAGAGWVEIAGPYDAPARRYRGRQVYGGIDEALVAMGDRYASLEWDRFERERAAPRPVVPTSPRTPPAPPRSRPATRPPRTPDGSR